MRKYEHLSNDILLNEMRNMIQWNENIYYSESNKC